MRTFFLHEDNPAVTEGHRCPLCQEKFEAEDECVLVPARTPTSSAETVPAILAHLECTQE